MKTSSKIAIAAAAVGAWLLTKKKGIFGIGKVDYSNFNEARVISTNGGRAIEFTIYGGNKGKYITVNSVYHNRMYPQNGLKWEYLSTIGEYKTLSGAIKAAKRYWDMQGVEYNPADFEKL